MLSDFYLVSALSEGTDTFGVGGLYASLAATAASRTTLAQNQLNASIEASEAKVSGYDALLEAVKGFQSAPEGFRHRQRHQWFCRGQLEQCGCQRNR